MSDIFFNFVDNLQHTQAVETAAKDSLVLQSILFSKDKYSVEECKKWLSAHKYKSSKVDSSGSYHRFRQRDPGDFQKNSFRTVEFSKDVKAIMGKLKN